MTAVSALARVRRRRRFRVAAVVVALSAIILVTAAIALTSGSFQAGPHEALDALMGRADGRTRLIVVDMRLPRILAALVIGAALAVAGAVFQTLSRNPLGSPDLVGFSTGSATGSLLSLVVLAPSAHPALGAWLGGVAVFVVMMLVSRGAGLARDRTVLIGVALAALFAAVNEYLLTRAPLDVARSAQLWLHGSLTASSFDDVTILLVVIVPLLLAIAGARRQLGVLELGDQMARSLGMRAGLVQFVLVLLALGLTGTAAAVAGPIGFVALAAPHIARRAVGGAGIPFFASAVTGAALLLVADVVAQRALAPLQIPVGLVTGALGGAYLFVVVARSR